MSTNLDDSSLHSLAAGAPTSDPLYKTVRAAITGSLANGEWKPGAMLPSEFSLAERFGVSKGTIRRALDELVADKILVRRQGAGTFVATHSRDRTLYHFFHLVSREGAKEHPVRELLSYRVGAGDDATCARLGLKPGSRVIQFRSLARLSGVPVLVDDITVAHALFRGLDRRLLADRDGTIYGLYQGRFHINVIRISEQLSAGTAPADVARRLEIARSSAVLVVERTAFSYHDRPVEIRTGWVDTRSYVYQSDLRKAV